MYIESLGTGNSLKSLFVTLLLCVEYTSLKYTHTLNNITIYITKMLIFCIATYLVFVI